MPQRDYDRTFSRHILLLKQPDYARFSGFNNRRLKVESVGKKKYIVCLYHTSKIFFTPTAFIIPAKIFRISSQEASLVEFHVRVSWLLDLIYIYLTNYIIFSIAELLELKKIKSYPHIAKLSQVKKLMHKISSLYFIVINLVSSE